MEFGWMFLRMIAVLAAVCALAFVMLRWGLRRFVPFDPSRSGRLEVVERLAVGPKRSILAVRAGREFLLVGSSEAGFELLGPLDADGWEEKDGDLQDGDLEELKGADELEEVTEVDGRTEISDMPTAAMVE